MKSILLILAALFFSGCTDNDQEVERLKPFAEQYCGCHEGLYIMKSYYNYTTIICSDGARLSIYDGESVYSKSKCL